MKGSDLRSYSTYRWIMSAPDLPEAARRRGMTRARLDRPRMPEGAIASGHSPVTGNQSHSPMPGLLIPSLVSSLGLLVLAVYGAYQLIHEIFG